MRRPFALLAGPLLVCAFAVPASAADGKGDQGFTINDPRIAESSGLAASGSRPWLSCAATARMQLYPQV